MTSSRWQTPAEGQGITVANTSDISCHSTCSKNTTDHTSSKSTFGPATETDLNQLKDTVYIELIRNSMIRYKTSLTALILIN